LILKKKEQEKDEKIEQLKSLVGEQE